MATNYGGYTYFPGERPTLNHARTLVERALARGAPPWVGPVTGFYAEQQQDEPDPVAFSSTEEVLLPTHGPDTAPAWHVGLGLSDSAIKMASTLKDVPDSERIAYARLIDSSAKRLGEEP